MDSLQGKVALITGGTSGIGEECVYALAEKRVKVVFCGRRAAEGKTIEQKCLDKGWEVKFIEADLLKYDNNKMLVDATVETYGKIDILLANAGGGGDHKALHEKTVEGWQHDVGIYIHSPFLLAKYAIPHMQRHGGGSIIFMSSATAYKQFPEQGGYGPGKAAEWQLARQISLEYCRDNIRANSVLPAATKTAMLSSRPATAAMAAAKANAGKICEVQDVVDAVLFLASDASKSVTSTQLIVDYASSAGIMPDLVVGASDISY